MLSLPISGAMPSVGSTVNAQRRRARRMIVLTVSLFLSFAASRSGSAATDASAKMTQLTEAYGKVPLSFEPNPGQTHGRVQFLSTGPGMGSS